MDERRLNRLLRQLLLISTAVPMGLVGGACGGTVETTGAGGTNNSAGAPPQAGANAAGAGSGGTSAGSGGTSAGSGGTSAGSGGQSAGSGGGGNSCRSAVLIGCAPTAVIVAKDCVPEDLRVLQTSLPYDTCKQICAAPNVLSCSVSAADETNVTVLCNPGCSVGRRPAGLTDLGQWDRSQLGGYFAEIAQLEAASIAAFRILHAELRAHRAPKRLVRAAARAARDEVRHARATGALSRRFGARPRLPKVEPGPLRALEAIALENAVEGCVRETFGALIATLQAERASDPLVRAAMQRIARDETRHAALAFSVGRWLSTRLSPRARQKVAQARQVAASELQRAMAAEPEHAFADAVGLPSAAEGGRLALEMQRALWA